METDSFPLCDSQDGIWYAQRRDPGSPVFMTGQALHLKGPLDSEALDRAIAQVGQEAQCLSLRFSETKAGPRQRLQPGGAPRMALRDLSAEADPLAAAEAAILAEAKAPADLAHGPIAGFTLWVLGPDHHILSERIHHLAADGYAMVLITNRIAELYNALVRDTAPGPAFPPYLQAVEAEARYREAPKRDKDRAFWHETLAGLGAVEGMVAGEATSARWFHRAEIALPETARATLHALSERTKLSWPDILTALSGAYLARCLPPKEDETHEVVLGVPLMNRMGTKASRVPASLVNVLPLRLVIDEDAALADWLAEAAARMAAMRRHGRYRGEGLRRDLGRIGAGQRLHGPLVNVLPFDATPKMEGLETRLQILGAGSVDDLTFCFRGDGGEGLLVQADANPHLYDLATTQAHAARLSAFLAAALGAERLADVATLTAEEHQTHVVTRNATGHPVPETTLAALISDQLKAAPEAEALVFGDKRYSAARLDAAIDDLAGNLAARGIGPGDVVAVALPRSAELIIALQAVVRAGAAYVPLDPEDASARRADMLERAAPRLVLAAGDFDTAGQPVPVLAPEAWSEGPRAQPVAPGPTDPAYVLFTSGSTGVPKGVVIEHRAIVNRLLWMRDHYGFGPGDRILQKTPATFDVSVWEFFLPFLSGTALVVAPPGAHRDPVQLAGIIRDEAITTAHFVPSMLSLFLAAPASDGLRIDRVFASGEALPVSLARQFGERITGTLHNLYGPTEAAVDVTYQPATGREPGASVPIGLPVWNTRLYLLDARGRPVPDGTAGRLYLAGRQLARGYLGRPDLTAERFPEDPFVPGERMYDTGDLAVAAADGRMTFLGRIDHQVKIRGVRIELGEIEAALEATGLVSQAVVLAPPDHAGKARLVAYVVAPDATGDQIRAALSGQLPAMMQPAAIMVLEAFPLNPSGKLDRKQLPAPQFGDAPAARAAAPGTEATLAALYAEILGLPAPASAEADFFAAGGDSLKAVQLSLAIEEAFGTDPGLGTIFEVPVLADLAQRIEQSGQRDDGLGPLVRLSQGTGTKGTLFAIHPAGGISWCYRRLARELKDWAVVGVQSPLLDPNAAMPDSLSELAAAYATRIAAEQPEGPVHLLGWSLGGIIAHAVAAHLEGQDRQIGALVLLDAYPSECWRNEPEPDEGAAIRALLAIAGHDPDAYPHLVSRTEILGFLRETGHPLGHLPMAAQHGVVRSVQEVNRLVRGHREPRVAAPVIHVHARLDHAGSDRTPQLWTPHAGALEVVDMDCRHADMVSDRASQRVAQWLQGRTG
ncbi:amino acid adenylation domain-containing protein [Pseudooceanicola sp. CBS1P-1]|uniref:Amino acid adenylation domain-containing protein n=2 Tax=Paracoccaceae TaxID=31989 RepID=A0A6L7G4G0_9RHOB|nr:amino acid adenylation domain-containing protein [Pseudooceanicola endophyticus]MXN18240.1 amino acid adenylation domain-containing protein [Pseudooceanicola albus]